MPRILLQKYGGVFVSVGVLAAGIIFALSVFFHLPDYITRNTVSFDRLRTCLEDPDTVILCARSEIQKLLSGRSGGEAMSFLEEALSSGQCHAVGHIVGQEVYKRTRNIEMSIAECGYKCTGSCVHGVIGEAMIQELGLTEDVDPRHLDPEYIKKAGKLLCSTRSTCHAVGHILFQIYNEFDQPLATCEDISSGGEREHCFRGVFMEHADTVSTHNLLLGTERKQLSDPQNLSFPCDGAAPVHQHACLRYLSRIQEPILEKQDLSDAEIRETKRKICETFSSNARSSCFEGYGFDQYNLVRSESVLAHQICAELSLSSDRRACTLGLIYPVADNGDIGLALSFCGDVNGKEEKNVCYHAVFEAAKLRVSPNLSFLEIKALCRSSDSECLVAAEAYAKDSWDTVFGVGD